jgi:hypothetical protein
MAKPLDDLAAAKVSVWLDDLSRSRIQSGSLARMVATCRDRCRAAISRLLWMVVPPGCGLATATEAPLNADGRRLSAFSERPRL